LFGRRGRTGAPLLAGPRGAAAAELEVDGAGSGVVCGSAVTGSGGASAGSSREAAAFGGDGCGERAAWTLRWRSPKKTATALAIASTETAAMSPPPAPRDRGAPADRGCCEEPVA